MIALLMPLILVTSEREPRAQVSSPDGKISVVVSAKDQLAYEVRVDGILTLAPSRLGLAFKDGRELGRHPRLVSTERSSHTGSWQNPFGKVRRVQDHYNEVTLHFVEGQSKRITFGVAVRAYDDGVALRYLLPAQPDLHAFTLTRDETEFKFPGDHRAWGGEFSSCTECQYPETTLGKLPPSNSCLPLLVETRHALVAISEADLLDWPGMFLAAESTVAFHGPRMDGHSQPIPIAADVSKFKTLVLKVDAGETDSWGHATWADARLVRADGTQVYLSDLQPITASQGWGQLQKDQSVGGQPISLRGRKFKRGLGTHTVSCIQYSLESPGGSPFVRFVAEAGIEDETEGKGSVEFVVAGIPSGKPTSIGACAELASAAQSTTPRQTPWRALIIGRKAGDLILSNLIANLSTPSKIRDVSWIKPGITAWDSWWTGTNPNLPEHTGVDSRGDTASHKEYIDFASIMGWPYQLVDWHWYDMDSPDPETAIKPMPHVDIQGLLAYAKAKRVGLILWVHSKDVHRIGAEKLFSTYQRWGVAGVKIDFMNDESQTMVKWYEETLECAAKHHLMVDFHGAYKPTGLARTWPNYITQEGVLGEEYCKLPGNRFDIKHMITLPFTRGLLGPADVTPGGFLNRTVSEFRTNSIPCEVMGTRARQLALALLMDSPLLCLADSPVNYRNQPGIEFFRGLPTVWDETRVLSSAVAEHLVEARRKGDDWWIGAMNSEKPLALRIPLRFLGKGKYTANLFADVPVSAKHPMTVRQSRRMISATDSLEISMVAGGGFTAKISPNATKRSQIGSSQARGGAQN